MRNRHGVVVDKDVAAAARTERNRKAAAAFEDHLLPHTQILLTAARDAIDTMLPARHHSAWKLLMDDLDHAAAQIHRILASPVEHDTEAARERDIALWPYLTAWAEHSALIGDLADQHHAPAPSLSADEQRDWTARAQAARRCGELDPFESWYDREGCLITLAYLVEHDDSTVLTITGDLDGARWQVVDHSDNEYAAGQSAPRPVPPGVLRPDVSRYTPRVPTPEVSLQELIGDVVEARHSGDVANALLTAITDAGHAPGAVVRMAQLITTAEEFADALETRQCQHTAARLGVIARQFDVLARELHSAAEELSAAVAVLPPHRIPRPRFVTSTEQPSLTTTPPAGPAPYRQAAPATRR